MRLFENIHRVDLSAFDWCLKCKHRDLLVSASRVISYTANGPFYGIAGALFLLMGQWPLVKLLALAFTSECILYFIFKSLFKRNRPPEAILGYKSIIEPSDKFSFPSGHTSAAFLFSGAIVFGFPSLAWFLYPWAASVGIARVMLGVHFPTDVLAGALLGHIMCAVLIAHMM